MIEQTSDVWRVLRARDSEQPADPAAVSVLEAVYDAFRRRDPRLLTPWVDAERTVWRIAPGAPWSGTYIGRAGLATLGAAMRTYFTGALEPRTFLRVGDHTVVEGVLVGTRPDGTEIAIPATHVARVAAGRLLELEVWLDAAVVRNALELS